MELVTFEDIIKNNSIEKLREAIREAAFNTLNEESDNQKDKAHWMREKPLEKFSIPESFRLKPEGLAFYFQPYEIASFARGVVEVVLPYNGIKPLLSARGWKLAKRIKL
jgi:hypothetical protein